MAALAAAHGTARETQAHPQEHDHQQQDSNAREGGQVGRERINTIYTVKKDIGRERINTIYTVKKAIDRERISTLYTVKKGYRQRKNKKYPLHYNKRLAHLFYGVGLHDHKRN